jgi:phosphoribosyl 1,2-cyclic phosphodiesterase
MKYGGNTSCVELLLGDQRIVLDAGTGLRPLGRSIMKGESNEAYLLLTHTHWDHVCGFPFFQPAFNPNFQLHVKAGHLVGTKLRTVLGEQMMAPLFPISLEVMRAQLSFEDFTAGDHFGLGRGIEVRTCALNHPNNATGYRIEFGGRSVCYITDTEHFPGRIDHTILNIIEGADVVIYDATFTDEEYPRHVGWGHSTWQEAVKLANAGRISELILFHHEPERVDTVIEIIEHKAAERFERVQAAREQMELILDF